MRNAIFRVMQDFAEMHKHLHENCMKKTQGSIRGLFKNTLHEKSELIGLGKHARHTFDHLGQDLGVSHRYRQSVVEVIVVPIHF